MAKTTKPESPRAKKKRATVTQRLNTLEQRMDMVERTVVARLDQFETKVISSLAKFTNEEYTGRNIFRGLIIGIGVLIVGTLFYIDGN